MKLKGILNMNMVRVSAVQMAMGKSRDENIERAQKLVREAASQGANIVLLPELFETPYFCQERNYEYYSLAYETEKDPAVKKMLELSRELNIVIPVSFFECARNLRFNSVAIIDCGKLLGVYRKTHIPDDHFYQEKFYFSPGDTGFKVFSTTFGKIGVGICWDQWFPEAARCMALMGAEILFYPTAIGSEPILDVDSMPHWRRCMQGHSAANIVPVVAANRVGIETVEPSYENNNQTSSLSFYGSSFITDEVGEIRQSADRTSETVITAEFDLHKIEEERLSWGIFRDRRPEQYGIICGSEI